MKKLISILLCFVMLSAAKHLHAQLPTGVSQDYGFKYYRYKNYVQIDSGILIPTRNLSWTPKGPALQYYHRYLHYWDSTGNTWQKVARFSDVAANAWSKTGDAGTSVSTNFLGTTDSIAFRLKVNSRDAGFISRSGMGASNIVVSYSNILLTYGQLAGKSLIPKVVAGTESGSGNHLWGPGAGMYLSESYDTTVGTTSSENMLFGTGSGHFMQKRGTGLASVGRNFFFSISGCMYCTDAAENTGIGAFTMETGFSAFKNFAGGSNALRTANSSRLMTATGAYASAYSGGVISAVTINSSSSDWTTATVTFSAPYSHGSPGACSQTATGTAVISGGQIVGITITNPGCGYSSRTQTFFTGFTSWYPTVTITGDGTSVSATVTVLQAEGTTSNGHAAGWLVRAPQYQLYLGEGSEPSTRYWDAYGGAIGKNAGIHTSISALQKITNGWAIGTNAKVSTDRTMAFGAPVGDTTLKFVFNGHTGDSTMTINNGGLDISSGLRVRGLSSPYGGHYTMPIITSTGSVINGWMTQDVGGSAIIRNDDQARGTSTTNAFLMILRNGYAGDGTSNASPMSFIQTTSSSATQKYGIGVTALNMPTGSTISNYIGYRTSTRNNFLHTFVFIGSGSTGNYMEEQFQGVGNISRRYASGNSTFGNTVTTDNGYNLEVGGKVRLNDSLWVQGGVRHSGLPTTAQARIAMFDANGNMFNVDTTGLFAGGGGGGGGLTVGTSTITGGSSGNILYNNAGVLGEKTTTGTGAVVLQTSPDFTTGATIGSVAIPTISSTSTLSNKRWVPRVGSTASSGTPTINTDNVDIYKLTAQAANITSFTTNLSGTPNDGDILEVQITDDGTPRTIAWGASFVSSTVTLPATTTTSTTLTVILQYYSTSSYGNNKWVCVNYY